MKELLGALIALVDGVVYAYKRVDAVWVVWRVGEDRRYTVTDRTCDCGAAKCAHIRAMYDKDTSHIPWNYASLRKRRKVKNKNDILER